MRSYSDILKMSIPSVSELFRRHPNKLQFDISYDSFRGALLPFPSWIFGHGFNMSKIRKTSKLSWFESAYRFRSSEYVHFMKKARPPMPEGLRYVSQFPSAIINFFYQPGMYQIWFPDQRHNHRRPENFSVNFTSNNCFILQRFVKSNKLQLFCCRKPVFLGIFHLFRSWFFLKQVRSLASVIKIASQT